MKFFKNITGAFFRYIRAKDNKNVLRPLIFRKQELAENQGTNQVMCETSLLCDRSGQREWTGGAARGKRFERPNSVSYIIPLKRSY